MQIDFEYKAPDRNISFEELIAAYRGRFLGSSEGRIVLDDLANRSHFFKGVATSNSNELQKIEGMRIMYLHIIYYLTVENKEMNSSKDYQPFGKIKSKDKVKDYKPLA